jgi:A/G-specific adenine glycosylase
MLQQTTVGAVVPYYEKWLRLFPDIKALARAPFRKVLRAWQGLGYYQRARNLHAAAKLMVLEHRSRIPRNYETLRSLPGFGPYTAAAVLSLAFDEPHPVLDANVRRVMMRLLALHGKADGRHDKAIMARLQAEIPVRAPGDFNQAMMELGALVCRSKNPQCLICPFRTNCRAFASGVQEVIPKPTKRKTTRITAVVGIIGKNGKILIQKRPAAGLLAGLWEFPGGKVKQGESRVRALAREIKEELGVGLAEANFLIKVKHSYTEFEVDLSAFAVRLKNDPEPKPGRRKWAALNDLQRYPFPSGSVKIIQFLENSRYGGHNTLSPGGVSPS